MDEEIPFSEPLNEEEEDDRSDAFDDFIEVPEVVKLPESSSSPEVIDTEGDQNDEEDEERPPEIDKQTQGNLEREPDTMWPSPPSIPDELSYVGAIEDIAPQIPSYSPPAPSEGSPSRPGAKTVEVPKATGYLSCLNALHPVVLYLIYWWDPKLSILSLVLSMVVLLTLYVNTFLHTLTLLLLAAMVVSLLYIVTKIAIDSFYNHPIVNPFHLYLEKDLSISEERVVQFSKHVARRLNCYQKFIVKTVFFANTINSLKFMAVLFLMSYVTNCLDILTSLFFGVMTAYTVPFVYNKYQTKIDSHINNMLFKLTNLYSRVVEKIPFLPKIKSD